ncbi:putative Secreted Protein [Cryptosporidium felis]|nr:putative Secreted Protein [Cryptosporidium felis]
MYTRTKLFVLFVIIVLFLFDTLNGAEAPGDSNNGDNEKSLGISDLNLNKIEASLLCEALITLLLTLFMFVLRISVLYDPNIVVCERLLLRTLQSGLNAYTGYNNKIELVKYDNSLKIQGFVDSIVGDLIADVVRSEDEGIKKQLDSISRSSSEIKAMIENLMGYLSELLTLGIEDYLQCITEILQENYVSWIQMLEKYSAIYVETPRRDLVRLVSNNLESIESISFDSHRDIYRDELQSKTNTYDEEYGELIDEYIQSLSDSNIQLSEEELAKAEELYRKYVSRAGLTDEESLNLEITFLTSANMIGFGKNSLFLFNRDLHTSVTIQVKELIGEVEEYIARGLTLTSFPADLLVSERIKIQELLRWDELRKLSFSLSAMRNSMNKDEVLVQMKKVYSFLLSLLKYLKSNTEKVRGSFALEHILSSIITVFEDLLKKALSEIKRCSQLPEDDLTINSLKMYVQNKKEEIKREKEKKLLRLELEVKMEKKKKREERKKLELIKEKEKEERRKGREEEKKIKETEKKSKIKTKKRQFPTVESSESIKSPTGDVRPRSRSRSLDKTSASESKAISTTSRTKSERKKEKLKKLQEEEARSEAKAQISEVKREQKSLQSSEKKRKQEDRKKKKDEKREKEKREREEEREREREEEKRRKEELELNNYLYSLLNSVSAVEGLFAESAKDQERGLGSLIDSVYSIILESSKEDPVEGISSSLSGLSLSGGQDSGLTASSGSSVGRRRADEVPSGAAGVPTHTLFGSGAQFATRRGRSRSRSRSKSGSRRTSKSKSKSRSVSKQRSRSRSKSTEKPSGGAGESRFMKFFKADTGTTKSGGLHGLEFFGVEQKDFSHITSGSTREEIEAALESCGSEITRLHVDVAPLVSGEEYLYLKLIENSLISTFIKLLLFLRTKDG